MDVTVEDEPVVLEVRLVDANVSVEVLDTTMLVVVEEVVRLEVLLGVTDDASEVLRGGARLVDEAELGISALVDVAIP